MSLRARGQEREFTYADFGVGVPTYSDVAFTAIPNIKYTSVDEWVIHRADSRRDPSPQYLALAGALTTATYFRGAPFSDGDSYIHSVGTGTGAGPGNATTYLRVATGHHIAHVLDRFATHNEP